MAKFKVTMKDPDHDVSYYYHTADTISPADQKLLNTFLEWGEYLQIEIDTDTKTARVVPVNER